MKTYTVGASDITLVYLYPEYFKRGKNISNSQGLTMSTNECMKSVKIRIGYMNNDRESVSVSKMSLTSDTSLESFSISSGTIIEHTFESGFRYQVSVYPSGRFFTQII